MKDENLTEAELKEIGLYIKNQKNDLNNILIKYNIAFRLPSHISKELIFILAEIPKVEFSFFYFSKSTQKELIRFIFNNPKRHYLMKLRKWFELKELDISLFLSDKELLDKPVLIPYSLKQNELVKILLKTNSTALNTEYICFNLSYLDKEVIEELIKINEFYLYLSEL